MDESDSQLALLVALLREMVRERLQKALMNYESTNQKER